MILTDMLYKPGFDYIKLEPFTGSYNGMRYRIWTVKEPYSFEITEDDKKTIKEFEFSKEGLESAIEWLSAEQEKYV